MISNDSKIFRDFLEIIPKILSIPTTAFFVLGPIKITEKPLKLRLEWKTNKNELSQ